MAKVMFKLTDVNNLEKVYICPNSLTYIRTNESWNWTDSRGNNKIGCTEISINGYTMYVVEHPAEILAMAEGRDPAPAKIMFGSSDE